MKISSAAILLLLLTVSYNSAARTPQSTNNNYLCSTTCDRNNDDKFQSGKAYIYQYESITRIPTDTNTNNEAELRLKSKVVLTAISNCNFKMSLQNVEIADRTKLQKDLRFSESVDHEDMKMMLEEEPVYFNREQGGFVESVCYGKKQSEFYVNIKKAIIDQIANYKKKGDTQMVSTGRVNIDISQIKYNSINPGSFLGDLAHKQVIEKAETVCTEAGKQDPMITSECTETVKIRPIKYRPDTITVKSTTQVKLLETHFIKNDNTKINQIQVKSSILQTYTTPSDATLEHASSTLRSICDNKKQSEQPNLFMKLVDQLKSLKSANIESLYYSIWKYATLCPSKQQYIKSTLIDALSYSQNPNTIKTMTKLMSRGEIKAEKQMSWFAGLAQSNQRITEENLNEIYELLLIQNNNQQLILGTGLLIRQFCSNQNRMEGKQCQHSAIIQKLFNKIKEPLGENCQIVNNDQTDRMSMALRSIQNAEYFSGDVMRTLYTCVRNKKTQSSIRIRVLEALQKRKDCENGKSQLFQILQDNQEDSEVRINAYLAIMKCVDLDVIFRVRKTLENEKTNQVGSFIWTHLTNIKESNDVVKSKIRSILQETSLKKEFNLSKLKYSRNIEKTIKTPIGKITVDSNVIFSEKSFVPRSVSLKTTSTILENPRDLLEVKARTEGLEEILFKLLGPEGYLKSKSGSSKEYTELMSLINNLRGSFDLKLFGEQISFMELSQGYINSIKKVNIIQELINLSKLQTMNVNKNIMLTDQTLAFFTIVGLPLTFRLRSAAAINSKVESTFQVSSPTETLSQLNLNTKVQPKIAAQLQADIVIKTPSSNYGLRYDLRSSTDMDVRASINFDRNNGLKVKLDLPKKYHEILDISSQLYLLRGYEQVKLNVEKQRKSTLCTGTNIIQVLGLKFCSEISLSTNKSPFLLPSNLRSTIYLKNVDVPKGYEFKSTYSLKNSNTWLDITFDTPNSRFNRKFSSKIQMKPYNLFNVELINPWTRFIFNLEQTTIENTIRHTAKGVWNDKIMFTYHQALTQSSSSGSYESSLKIMDDKEITIKYHMTDLRQTFNFHTEGIFKERSYIEIISKRRNPAHAITSNKYQFEGKYQFPFAKGNVKGDIQERNSGIRFSIKINNRNKNKITTLSLFHKMEDENMANYLKYIIESEFRINSDNVFQLKSKFEHSEKLLNFETKVDYGTFKNKESIEFNFYNGYTALPNQPLKSHGTVKLRMTPFDLLYEGQYKTLWDASRMSTEIKIDKNEQPVLNAAINYNRPKLYLPDCTFVVNLEYLKYTRKIEWSLKQIDVGKYEYELNLDRKASIKGVHTTTMKWQHQSEISVKLPTDFKAGYHFNTAELSIGFDLIELTNSKLIAKLKVPQIKYSLGVDTEFSYRPQNFLVQPKSANERGHVLTYKTIMHVEDKQYGTKFEFICNPAEFKLYSNVFWENQFQQLEMNLHYQQTTPKFKQTNSAAEISLTYPGNYHKISFRSEFDYLSLQANLDITLNRNKKFSIMTMYDIDNGWTQKGITAQLTIKTPIPEYAITHIGVNAVGQLRYRKVDLEVLYGKNKKIKFEVIVEPRSSSDFTVSSKLVTPFNGLALIETVLKHMYSEKAISSQATLNIGTGQQHLIKFEAVDNTNSRYDSQNARDITASLQIDSPGLIPSTQVILKHTDNQVKYETNFKADWMNTKYLQYNSIFELNQKDKIFNSDIRLQSSCDIIKDIKFKFNLDIGTETYVSNIDMFYNNDNIFKSYTKVYKDVLEDQALLENKWNIGSTISSIYFEKIQIKGNVDHTYNKITYKMTELKTALSAHQNEDMLFEHIMEANTRMGQHLSIKIKLPKLKEINEVKLNLGNKLKTQNKEMFYFDIKVNEKYLTKQELNIILDNMARRNVKVKCIYSIFGNYYRKHMLTLTNNFEYNPKKVQLELNVKNDIENTGIVSFKTSVNTKKELDIFNLSDLLIDLVIKTKFQPISDLRLQIDYVNSYDNMAPFKFQLHTQMNTDYKITEFLSFNRRGPFSIKFSSLYKTNYDNYFLKFKHENHQTGFTQTFDTNLYKPMNYECSLLIRAPLDFHVKLKTTILPLLESIDLSINEIARNERKYNFAVKYNGQWTKLEYHQIETTYFLVKIYNKYITDSLLKVDIRQYNKLNIKISYKPILDISLNNEFNINILKSAVSVQYFDQKFTFSSNQKIVKWQYISSEIQIMSENIWSPNDIYKLGAMYDLKPSNRELKASVYFNENFIKLNGEFDNTKSKSLKVQLSTSSKHINDLQMDIEHMCNKMRREMYQKLEMTLKSNDRVYTLKHTHKVSPTLFKLNTDLTLSNNNLLQININIPLSIKSSKSFIMFKTWFYSEEFELKINSDMQNLKQLNFNFNLDQNKRELASIKLNYNIKNGDKMIFDNKISIESLFKHQMSLGINKVQNKFKINLLIFNSLLVNGQFETEITFENPTSASLKIKYDSTNLVKFNFQLDKASISVNLKIQDEFSVVMILSNNKDYSINIKMNTKQHNFKFQNSLNDKHLITTIKYNKHSVIFKGYRQPLKLSLNLRIMGRVINLQSGIQKETFKWRYFIKGTTNIKGFKIFKSDFIIRQLRKDSTLVVSQISIEGQDVYKNTIKTIWAKYLSIDLSTKLETMKTLNLVMDASSLPDNFKLYFIHNTKTQFNVQIRGSKFNSYLKSDRYNWEVEGKLQTTSNKKSGEFTITSQKLEKPITGHISIENKGTETEIDIKLPFLNKFNQLSVYIDQNRFNPKLTFKENNEKVLEMSASRDKTYKFTLDIRAKSLANFKLNHEMEMDIVSDTKYIKVNSQSSLWDKVNLELTCKPKKQVYEIKLITSIIKTDIIYTNNQIKSSIEYLDVKHELMVKYDLDNYENVNLEFLLDGAHSIDFNYNHKISSEKGLLIDQKSVLKMNKETVWSLQTDYSFKSELTQSKVSTDVQLKIQMNSQEFEITMNRVNEDIRINFKTPIEIIKQVQLIYQNKQFPKFRKTKITLESNYLGEFKIDYKYEQRANIKTIEATFTCSQLPDINLSITRSIDTRNILRSIKQLKFNIDQYHFVFNVENQSINLLCNTPFYYLNKLKVSLDKNNFKATYNNYNVHLKSQLQLNVVRLQLISNIDQLENVLFHFQRTGDNIVLKVGYSDKLVVVNLKTNQQQQLYEIEFENTLIPQFPNQLSGLLNIYQLKLKLKIEQKSIIYASYTPEKLLIVTPVMKLQSSMGQQHELILLNSDTFRLNIVGNVWRDIDARLTLNQQTYTLTSSLKNDAKRLLWKMSISDNLLHIQLGWTKTGSSFNSVLSYKNEKIIGFKYDLEMSPSKYILKSESTLLKFNAVIDMTYENQLDTSYFKLGWNIMKQSQQLQLGSFSLSLSTATNKNILLILNLMSGVYEFGITTQNSYRKVNLKLITPIPGINYDISLNQHLNTYNRRIYLNYILKNSIVGEYNFEMNLDYTNNVPLKITISNSKVKLVTFETILRRSHGLYLETKLRLLEYRPFFLTVSYYNMPTNKFEFAIGTPFSHFEKFGITMDLQYNSLTYHKVKFNCKYIGFLRLTTYVNHEFRLSEKLYQLESSTYRDATKLFSVIINHTGDHKSMNHSTIWKINKSKYGWKLNGKMTPQFSGQTEFYFPFVGSNEKVSLLAKQSESGFEFESSNQNSEIAKFEYNANNGNYQLNVLPYPSIGKRIDLQVQFNKRTKRSAEEDNDNKATEFTLNYGGKQLMNMKGEYYKSDEKLKTRLQLRAPMLTDKKLDVSIFTTMNDDKVDFDHYLKWDDKQSQLYRIFGQMFMKDARNLNGEMNVEIGSYGKFRSNMGHSVDDNKHTSFLMLQQNGQTILNYNGQLMLDLQQNKYSGEWTLQVKGQNFKTSLHYQAGNIKQIENRIFYNNIPIASFKSKSDFTHIFECQLKIQSGISIELKKNKHTFLLATNVYENILKVSNHKGKFIISYLYKNMPIAYIDIIYGNNDSLKIQTKFYQHFLQSQIKLENDKTTFSLQTSFKRLEDLTVSLTKTSLDIRTMSDDQVHYIVASYNVMKDQYDIKIKIKCGSYRKYEFNIKLGSESIAASLNQYRLNMIFKMSKNSLMMRATNNFMPFTSLDLDMNMRNKVYIKLDDMFLKVNALKLDKSNIDVQINSNIYSIKSIKFAATRSRNLFFTNLKLDEIEVVKVEILAKQNGLYQIDVNSFPISVKSELNLKSKQISFFLRYRFYTILLINKIKTEQSITSVKTTIDTNILSFRKLQNTLKLDLSTTQNSIDNELVIDNTRKYGFYGALKSLNVIKLNIYGPWTNYKVMVQRNTDKIEFELENNGRIVKCNGEFNSKTLNFDATYQFVNSRVHKLFTFTLANTNDKYYLLNLNIPDIIQVSGKYKEGELKITYGRYTPIEITMKLIKDSKDITTCRFHILNLYGSEFGVQIAYRNQNAPYTAIFIENKFHIVGVSKSVNKNEQKWAVLLENKSNNKKWNLSFQSKQNKKFHFTINTPNIINGNIVLQLSRKPNNQLQSFQMKLFDILDVSIQQSKLNTFSGKIKLFEYEIGQINIYKESTIITFNPSTNKHEQITVTLTKKLNEKSTYYSSQYRILVQQKAKNINLDINHILKSDLNSYTNEFSIKHLTIDKIERNYKLSIKLDKSQSRKIQIDVLLPYAPLKLQAEMIKTSESDITYKFQLSSKKKQIGGLINLNTGEKRGITARYHYDPDQTSRYIQAHFKYLSSREFETAIFKGVANKIKEQYFKISIQSIAENKIRWVYFTNQNLQPTVRKYMNTAFETIFETLQKSIDHALKELYDQGEIIMGEITKTKHMNWNKVNRVVKGIESLGNEIYLMIRRNGFYIMKNMYHFIFICENLLDDIKQDLPSLVNEINSVIIKTAHGITRIISGCLARFNSMITVSLSELYDAISLLKIIIRSYNSPLLKTVMGYIERANMDIKSYINLILVDVPISMKRLVVNMYYYKHDLVKAQLEIIKSVQKSLKDILPYIRNYWTIKLERYINTLDKNLSNLRKYVTKLENSKFNYLYLGSEKSINAFIDLAIVGMKHTLFEVKPEEILKDVMLYVTKNIDGLISDSQTKLKDLTSLNFIKVYANSRIFNHYLLDIAFTFPLPIIKDLQSLPDFSVVRNKINKIQQRFDDVTTLFNSQVNNIKKFRQLLNWFTPYISLKSVSILPEFQKYATLAPTVITTFDKQTYSLLDKPCRIVLIKESLYNHWKLSIQKLRSGKVYEFELGKSTLKIPSNGEMVSINDKIVNLPVTFNKDVTVVSVGKIVKMNSKKYGLTLNIDVDNDILTVGLSNWYHGKVSGLFGNADNEPMNDLMTNSGKMVDIKEFVKEFSEKTPTKTCSIKLNVQKQSKFETQTKPCPFIRKMICKFLYRCPVSPLAGCFKSVDPSKFYQICLSSSDPFQMKADTAVCDSARSYAAQCKKAGVPVPLPYPCRKCSINQSNREIFVDETTNVKTKSKEVDIVMVVSEDKCINELKNNLKTFVNKLDKTMYSNGITQVRYGLVSSGSTKIVHPHSHSVGYKLFGNKNDLIKTLDSLNTNNQNPNTNTKESLDIALNYPYTTYASSQIIYVSCDQVKDDINSLKPIFKARSITFNYLTPFSFSSQSNANKKVIYGVDKDQYYGLLKPYGDSRNKLGDSLIVPQSDSLYKLSMEQDGVVYNIKMNNERFIKSLTTQIKRRAKPVSSAQCTCSDDQKLVCKQNSMHLIYPARKSD